jgi:hypothetical protein
MSTELYDVTSQTTQRPNLHVQFCENFRSHINILPPTVSGSAIDRMKCFPLYHKELLVLVWGNPITAVAMVTNRIVTPTDQAYISLYDP